MQRRRASLVALSLALLVAGLLAAVLFVELRATVPDASVRDAVAAGAKQRAAERRAGFAASDRTWDVPFAPGMVRDRVNWVDPTTRRTTTDIVLVNATPGADLAKTGRACAAWAAKPGRRVQCYAFASTEAYEFKFISRDIDTTMPTAIVNLCWATLATREPDGATTISDMHDAPQVWTSQGCPTSWKGVKG